MELCFKPLKLERILAVNDTNLHCTFLGNPYPGRIIMVGMTELGKLIQLCAVTGRSESSRNRVYTHLGNGIVTTEVADTTRPTGDPEKTIYSAMMGSNGVFVVSNGRQTEDFFTDALKACSYHTYEDDPLHTPRITALCDMDYNDGVEMCILREGYDGSCECHIFSYEKISPGIGYVLSTYLGDGNPPPHYHGEPYTISLPGTDPTQLATSLWHTLNADNRVCLALKVIDLDTGMSEDPIIINKYEKVA